MSHYSKNAGVTASICRTIEFIETRFVEAIFEDIILKQNKTFNSIYAVSEPSFRESVKKDNSKNEYFEQFLSFDYNADIQTIKNIINKEYIVKFKDSDGKIKVIGSLKQPAQISIVKTKNVSKISFVCKSYTPVLLLTS